VYTVPAGKYAKVSGNILFKDGTDSVTIGGLSCNSNGGVNQLWNINLVLSVGQTINVVQLTGTGSAIQLGILEFNNPS
jgi:hypothetical protein